MNQQLSFSAPRARVGDPITAHEAASVVAPGNEDMVHAIRRYLYVWGPATAFVIADGVESAHPGRWQKDSIRSACARAGLMSWPGGKTPRGRSCLVYGLRTETVETELV